jgi:hypothetical protein
MSCTMAKKKTVQATADREKTRTSDRHKQPRLAFHLPQEMFDAFNEYVESLEPRPNESAVLRMFLERGLRAVGRWPRAKGDDDDRAAGEGRGAKA